MPSTVASDLARTSASRRRDSFTDNPTAPISKPTTSDVAASSQRVAEGSRTALHAGEIAASVEVSAARAGRAMQLIDDALAESSQATRDIAAQMERVAQTAERDTETARRSADEARQVGILASKLKALAVQFKA